MTNVRSPPESVCKHNVIVLSTQKNVHEQLSLRVVNVLLTVTLSAKSTFTTRKDSQQTTLQAWGALITPQSTPHKAWPLRLEPKFNPLTNNYPCRSPKNAASIYSIHYIILTYHITFLNFIRKLAVFQWPIALHCEARPVLRTRSWLPAALWSGNPYLYPSYNPHDHPKIPLIDIQILVCVPYTVDWVTSQT